jgi:hypothetical protein
MYRPSSVMNGQVLVPKPFVPSDETLSSVVVPDWRSRTNTSKNLSVSSGASVVDMEKNTA